MAWSFAEGPLEFWFRTLVNPDTTEGGATTRAPSFRHRCISSTSAKARLGWDPSISNHLERNFLADVFT